MSDENSAQNKAVDGKPAPQGKDKSKHADKGCYDPSMEPVAEPKPVKKKTD